MNRRRFVRQSMLVSGAAAVGSLPSFPQSGGSTDAVKLRLDPKRSGKQISRDFTGLSYESAQLSDPTFFSGANTALIELVRGLGEQGVLRIGGNTSEYCFWTPNGTGFATADDSPLGPDPGHKPAVDRKITPLAIRNLRDFVDATGWTLIYGLNMGKGTSADATAEAAYVFDTVGKKKLLAFQLCNEPDLFSRNGIRKPDYNALQFNEEWKQYHDAIRAKVAGAPFAGPDTAYGQDWLVPFASRFKGDVNFLSSHYYALGPPTDPAMTIERMLANPKLKAQLDGMQELLADTGLPFRLAETNSCYAAGKQGVSDTFAAALWGSDLMYQLAQAGGMGINFHGGGYGWYTPIAGTTLKGFVARPIYYGMLMFARAGHGTLVETNFKPAQSSKLSAYGLQTPAGKLKVIVFNKDLEHGVRMSIEAGQRVERATLLSLNAPRIDDTMDTTLGNARVGKSGSWVASRKEVLPVLHGDVLLELPPGAAALVSFD